MTVHPQPGPETEAQPAAARPQGIYERLREAILSLRLLPGEKISERALETMLGGSRTPIRAALQRLEAEGLMQREGRSHRVAPIELTEMLEVFEYREHLETAVAHLACERASAADLAELQKILDAGLGDDTPATWFAIGADFHVRLATLSGNRFLERGVRDVVTRIARARWMMASMPDTRGEAHAEHSRILRLIAARRGAEAAEALAVHGRVVRGKITEAIAKDSPSFRARGLDVIEEDTRPR